MKAIKTTYMYARVSSMSQEIGSQTDMRDPSWGLITDDGISGRVPFELRKGGAAIIKLVEKGAIKELVCYSVSRLGRNSENVMHTMNYLHSKGVGIRILNLNIVTLENGMVTQLAVFLTTLFAGLAEQNYIDQREASLRGIARVKGQKEKYKGRLYGAVESLEKFKSKPKVKAIWELIENGVGLRVITRTLKCSSNYVIKVKNVMKMEDQKMAA